MRYELIEDGHAIRVWEGTVIPDDVYQMPNSNSTFAYHLQRDSEEPVRVWTMEPLGAALQQQFGLRRL
jgi:hypothetical protein